MDITDLKAKYDECMSRTCARPCRNCDINMPQDVWETMGVIIEYLEEVNIEGEQINADHR